MSITRLPTRQAWPHVTVDCFGPLLHQPVESPPDGQVLQFGTGVCHQVSQTQAVLLINRRVTGVAVVDFENGWDVLVFDSIDGIKPEHVQPGMANTDESHPRTGEPLTMVHHTPQGGFVPLGATLPDGSPHPHAGTGFGISVVHGYPKDNSAHNAHIAADMHAYLQLIQFAFDGEKFAITQVENLPHDQIVPGHISLNRGLGPGIMDGEDLIFGMVAGKLDETARAHAQRLAESDRKPYNSAHAELGECYGSGLARFRRGDNGWRCIDFTPVPEYRPDMAFEPSLVRDHDGALLMAMRGRGANVPPGEFDEGLENTFEHFRLYRSTDNGKTWESVIHLPEMRAPSPVTINKTAGGRLFIAANPWRPLETDSKGRTVTKYRQRDRLWLWPVNDDRRGVGEPFHLLDCNEVLGEPRAVDAHQHDNRWYADHPVSGVFRLADGKKHTLLGFRLTDAATTSGGGLPTEQSGVWFAELHEDDV